jgi:N-acetylglucosaminyldiphosphoundecaprenol N-acetyl-beta-D-mannosaminyltransferase
MNTDTKRSVLGVEIDAVTPQGAVERVIAAASDGRTYRVSALAVHGVMEAHDDPVQALRLNEFEMVTPDGQPVRWALNLLYGAGLKERVYGPTLMLNVCERAAAEGLSIYLLGTTDAILADLQVGLLRRFPELKIAGMAPSKFRKVDSEEFDEICQRIRDSGAQIVFVGLGCPRQEVFAYESGPRLNMPVLAVGAAFEYHAGHRDEPPMWIQRSGLQWLHRLLGDPKRLWKRYATTNPRFVAGVARQRLGGGVATPEPGPPPFVGWA